MGLGILRDVVLKPARERVTHWCFILREGHAPMKMLFKNFSSNSLLVFLDVIE